MTKLKSFHFLILLHFGFLTAQSSLVNVLIQFFWVNESVREIGKGFNSIGIERVQ